MVKADEMRCGANMVTSMPAMEAWVSTQVDAPSPLRESEARVPGWDEGEN